MADEKYKGKRIFIIGIADKIGKDILNKAYVTVVGPIKKKMPLSIQAFVSDEFVAKLGQVKPGDALLVVGTCRGKMGNVLLSDAVLRTAEEAAPIFSKMKMTEYLRKNKDDNWDISESKSEMDDSEEVLLQAEADDDISDWLGQQNRPKMLIRCAAKKTDLYIDLGTLVQQEFGEEGHAVRLRLDDGKPVSQRWTVATNNKALFAPRSIELIKQMTKAKILRFSFTPFRSGPVVVNFDLRGLEQHTGRLAQVCHWK